MQSGGESRGERQRREAETRGRDEGQRREAEAEAEAEAKAEAEAEAEAEPRRETPMRKPAEFRAMNVKRARAGTAGNARSFIGTRNYARRSRHARAARDAHLAPLTPLTGAAVQRGRVRRAHKQQAA